MAEGVQLQARTVPHPNSVSQRARDALAFMAAAASFMAEGAHMAFMLFSAAGLIGAALASGGQIAGKGKLPRALAIGRHR